MVAEKRASRSKTEAEEKVEEAPEAFSWEEWIEEGVRGLRQVAADLGVPEEFLEHSCEARREARLACKALLRGFGENIRELRQKVARGKAKSSRPVERIQIQ